MDIIYGYPYYECMDIPMHYLKILFAISVENPLSEELLFWLSMGLEDFLT